MAENKEFRKALEMTRPGIGKNLFSGKDLAGKHLTREHDKIDEEMNKALRGRYVVLSQDGWSNIHREPIIASCLHVPGKTFLHDAVDVGDLTKNAEYCASLAKASIEAAEEKYGCTVIGFVSDSESKMVKVRQILHEWRGKGFIVYGCSAHYVNLAQSSATPPSVKARIQDIQKFFRNHQKPAAKLKNLGGKIPQLPNETRWTSFSAFLETFNFNYELYLNSEDPR